MSFTHAVLRNLLHQRSCWSQHLTLTDISASCAVLYQQNRFRKRSRVRVSMKPKPKKQQPARKVTAIDELDPDIKYAGRVVQDDVWISKYYPTKRYSILETVKRHREAAASEIFDNENGLVYLNCTLDLRTKKQTKFMPIIQNTVVLPHNFDDGKEHRIMVFAKTAEDLEIAEELGAEYFGSVDLIKRMAKGEIKPDEYDHVICTLDMIVEIASIRKILKDNFPHKNKGNIGTDLSQMMTFFSEGKTYESYKENNEAVGYLEVPVGLLSMEDSALSENYDALLENVCAHRSADLGQFITECSVHCPPSNEIFSLEEKELLPPSQREIKVKKLVQDKEPATVQDDDDDSDDEEQPATARR